MPNPIKGQKDRNPKKPEKAGKSLSIGETYYRKFEERTEKIPKSKLKEFVKKTKEWENSGDIAKLRQAGISAKDNEKDPLQKHALLSAAYLAKVGPRKYKIDFKGNKLSEDKVGAGDIFPDRVKVISVNGRRAVRAVNPRNQRIGYYFEKELNQNKQYGYASIYSYAPIYSEDIVEILEFDNRGEEAMKKVSFREHMALYELGGGTAVEEAELTPKERRTRGVTSARKSTKQDLSSLKGEVEIPVETSEMRRKIVEKAKSYIGSTYFQKQYYEKNKVYKEGRLGCAVTTSTILADADAMSNKGINAGVNAVERNLLKDGWTSTPGYNPATIEPGDVIIWRRWRGHKEVGRHIGIIVSVNPPMVVHNVFRNGKASPRMTPIKNTNQISAILKPPGGKRATTKAPQRKSRSVETSSKVGSAIERTTARWMPLIEKSCKKHGITRYKKFIQAIMFVESSGRPNVTGKNKNGTVDRGLMQLNSKYYKHPKIMNPEVNIDMGVKSIASLIKRYRGNLIDVAASYNCGHAEGETIGKITYSIPNATKKTYVPKVMRNLRSLGFTDIPAKGNFSSTRYA